MMKRRKWIDRVTGSPEIWKSGGEKNSRQRERKENVKERD